MTDADKAIHEVIVNAAAELGLVALREPTVDEVTRYVMAQRDDIEHFTFTRVETHDGTIAFDVAVTLRPQPVVFTLERGLDA